ncbi:TPA: carbonic anhydrase [Burkholderia vietnamiensis]|nr:carbonic anhydrase [Burkholderia vietnamiensis]
MHTALNTHSVCSKPAVVQCTHRHINQFNSTGIKTNMCKSDTCKTATNHPARRQFIRMAGVSALGVAASGASLTSFAATPDTRPLPKPLNAMSPDAAISRLKEGNARYVAGLMLRHDFAHERESLGTGQNPYAAVLSCADSRIAPEYAFDSARGDLFAVRVAGNFVNDDVLGSLEYAVAVLKTPVILVLGHDKCGAVSAAVNIETKGTVYPGKIQDLAMAMLPSVRQAQRAGGVPLDAAIAQNVKDSVRHLSERSTIISGAKRDRKLKIIGGIYRLATGHVDFIV